MMIKIYISLLLILSLVNADEIDQILSATKSAIDAVTL